MIIRKTYMLAEVELGCDVTDKLFDADEARKDLISESASTKTKISIKEKMKEIRDSLYSFNNYKYDGSIPF